MLVDFVPALMAYLVFFWNHETGVQISREGEAFVKDQGHAVIAMTGGMEYLSVQSNTREKLAALLQFQDKVILLLDLDVGIGFPFEEFSQLWNEVNLRLQQEKLYPLIFEFLCETGMVGMKMCNQEVFDFTECNPLSFEFCREFRECSGPAAVNQ